MAVPDSSSISHSATVPGAAAAAPAGAARANATAAMPASRRRPLTGWCRAALAGLDTRRPCRWRRGQIRSAEVQPTLIRARCTCKGRGDNRVNGGRARRKKSHEGRCFCFRRGGALLLPAAGLSAPGLPAPRRLGLHDAENVPASPFERRIEHRERLQTALADLDRLPVRQRSALVLRELGGLSDEEIASALGISASGVRQAVFEARTALKDFGVG